MSVMLRRNWFFNETWNFSEPPPREADVFFGKAILVCAKGDGELSQPERDFIVGYFATIGAPESMIEELQSYEGDDDLSEMVAPIPDPGIHNAIIYFALKACSADGELSDGERSRIHKLASQLKIKPDMVNSIYDLYQEELQMRDKRLKVLFPAGSPF